MNTTYTSRLKPQFSNAGVQDVTADFSGAEKGLELLAKENENELKALKNIAQDQAQIEFNRGAAELVDKYGTDFKGLSQAMLGLEQDLYNRIKPTQPEMAEDLLRKYDAARLRAVDHAHKTYMSENNKKIRETSKTMLGGIEAAATSDYLIYLGEISKKPEERNPENINPFLQDLAQHNAILDRLDMDGNPIFTPEYKVSKKGMKGVMLNATYDLINGMTLEQLENWRNTTLQSEQFRKDSGFDSDDWEKINSKANSRIKELEKDGEHEIKVRAIQDTAGLLAEYNQEKVDELRENSNAPKALVKKAQELSNKIVMENWYDPKNTSDPTGMFEALASMGEIVNNKDTSSDAMEIKLEKGVDIMDTLVRNAPKMNLSNDEMRQIGSWVYDSIVNDGFAKQIQMLDVSPWVNGVVEARRADMQKNFAWYEPKAQEKLEKELEAYHEQGKLTPLEEKAQEQAIKTTWKSRGSYGRDLAHKLAYDNAKKGVAEVMDYLRDGGNIDIARNMMNKVKYNYVKTYNSNWIPNSDFDRLQEEFDNGKTPTYFHNGILWEYQGYQNNGAIFKVKL